jgi:hypothetical protein
MIFDTIYVSENLEFLNNRPCGHYIEKLNIQPTLGQTLA